MPEQQHRGLFLAFEGGEGSGKSTQIRRLTERLDTLGIPATVTREPGAGQVGQAIRNILLSPDTCHLDPRAEALLFAADRAQHVATLIRPALTAGHVVITDRYMDSSAAYQGTGRDLGLDEVLNLSMWATGGLVPDLTVLLDIDPSVGLARATTSEFGQADRFESEKIDFLHAVRGGFLHIARNNPDRYAVIDANQEPDQVTADVWAAVTARTRLGVTAHPAAR